jgi:transglutaminase-like putative cysteine protease
MGGHHGRLFLFEFLCQVRVSHSLSLATRSDCPAFNERRGVCRDFAHLAIAFCRRLNIPALYCTGYVSDIGILPPHAPMDFAACMEVYLGGRLVHLRSTQQ